jgi:hypothetical protein
MRREGGKELEKTTGFKLVTNKSINSPGCSKRLSIGKNISSCGMETTLQQTYSRLF